MDAENRNNSTSLIMLIGAMVIFGTIGLFRRLIPLPSGMLAFARGLIGAAFLLIYMAIRGRKGTERLARSVFARLVISGALIGLNWMLLFEAYNYTSVAVATLCYYMQPVIVILLSPLVFGERLTGRKCICVAAAFLGMILVSGAGSQGGHGNMRGVIFGLGAAALYATVVMMNKQISGVDPYKKTMIQLASAALVMVPYLALTGTFSTADMTASSLWLVLLVGLLHTGIAYVMYFASMDGLRAQTIAMLSYIDPVTALILSALILHEGMTLRGLIGAVLILGAAFISGREG